MIPPASEETETPSGKPRASGDDPAAKADAEKALA